MKEKKDPFVKLEHDVTRVRSTRKIQPGNEINLINFKVVGKSENGMSIVQCPICTRTIRIDTLERHQKSSQCRVRAVE